MHVAIGALEQKRFMMKENRLFHRAEELEVIAGDRAQHRMIDAEAFPLGEMPKRTRKVFF